MMRRLIFFVFGIVLIGSAFDGYAAEWQWSTEMPNTMNRETERNSTAYLWIPPDCKHVNAIVIGQHNMLEEGILEHKAFRKNLQRLGIAEIWITPVADFVYHPKSNEIFQLMLDSLARISGYGELRSAPIIPIGHSAAASYPWNFAAFNPTRTLAILSIHGDAPLTNMTGSGKPNPDWGAANIDGIPSLFVMGEYEWLEGRINPLLKYQSMHPKSTISALCDAGHGHFDFSDELVDYLNTFIRKSVYFRLKTKEHHNPPILNKLNPENGWLIDRWRNNSNPEALAAPYTSYKGNRYEATWVFDEEMASLTEAYYAAARGKIPRKIVYMQNGITLDSAKVVGFKPQFKPLADGITFHLKAQDINITDVEQIGKSKVSISRICGPVLKINDTTFRVSFDKVGFDNRKRSNVIWFMASQKSDQRYKSAVQQAEMRIPITNLQGIDQRIDFTQDQNIPSGTSQIALAAISSAGLPVNYYVKFGPARIEKNKLVLSTPPPMSKYPIKISVVAWQYGMVNANKAIKSAAPVERVFFLQQP